MKKLMLASAISIAAGAGSGALPALAADAQPAAAPAAVPARPAGMPEYGKDKPLPSPHIARKTLANGLQVWVVPRNGVPRVDMVLAVRGAGHIADDAAHAGFARLMAGLLNEGTARHDSRAIAELAQSLGGSVGASASADGMTVSANALASQAGPMMQLLAEVARTPSFPAKEVALAKANALQALRVAETQPRFRADRALNRALFGEHPYGHIDPSVAAIEATDVAFLRAEHARRFRPDQALLVITGRIKEAEAMKLAARAFGDWKAPATAPVAMAPAAAGAKPVRVLLERPGSVQSTIRLGGSGIAATAEDQVPLRMASTVLGGGFSSRININLREVKGYTYGASAGARMMREGGSIVGGADVRNEVTAAALDEYFSEYKRIGTELVAPDEMEMHKRYVAGGYVLSNQMQRAVAATLASNWLVGLPPEFLAQYVPLIQKVTPEQVRDVSRKYFDPARQSIVVVGDSKAVGEQLKAFGEFSAGDR